MRKERKKETLLGRRVGHLASDDFQFIYIESVGIVELERSVAHAERPHLLAQPVVLEVALKIRRGNRTQSSVISKWAM